MKASNCNHTRTLLAASYVSERRRVDRAHRRMREISAIRHSPARAREAARELDFALQEATGAAARARQAAACTTTQSSPQRHPRRRKADRSVPPAVRPWAAELGRLADIGIWLLRTTLDDKGVLLPDAVRVANYAAKGPHLAGLDFGNQAAEQPGGPLIGINLLAAVDGTGPGVATGRQSLVAAAAERQGT